MIASTSETKTNGSGREVPIPSVSLGLGNDLDPKFGRWVIVGSIVGFLIWAVIDLIDILSGDYPTKGGFKEKFF